jgi:hypothetical protein
MPINTQEEKELLAKRNSELSKKINRVTVKVAKISNGYKVIEVGTGEEFCYPGLGFYTEKSPNGATNVLEHLADFFARLESEDSRY